MTIYLYIYCMMLIGLSVHVHYIISVWVCFNSLVDEGDIGLLRNKHRSVTLTSHYRYSCHNASRIVFA